MTARAGSPPARAMVRRSVSGSGFFIGKVSCPQIAAKRCVSPSASSRRSDRASYLLVQTARRKPFSARRSSAASTPGIGPRPVCDVILIMADIAREHFVDLFGRKVAILLGQRAFDQRANAGADQRARLLQRDRRQPLLREYEIERADQDRGRCRSAFRRGRRRRLGRDSMWPLRERLAALCPDGKTPNRFRVSLESPVFRADGGLDRRALLPDPPRRPDDPRSPETTGRRPRPRICAPRHAARPRHRLDRQAFRRASGRAGARGLGRDRRADLGGDARGCRCARACR